MSENQLLLELSKIDEARTELRSKMKAIREEWLSYETKLIGLNLERDKIQDKLAKIKNSY